MPESGENVNRSTVQCLPVENMDFYHIMMQLR